MKTDKHGSYVYVNHLMNVLSKLDLLNNMAWYDRVMISYKLTTVFLNRREA